jgi:photosystem II stability/assembly factor-like uncharacterized protein
MKLKILICFALILGGVLLGCSIVVRGDIIPSPKSAQLPPAPEFDSIHMIDREKGWAKTASRLLVANDWKFPEELILRTTDGGRSWVSVLSAKPQQCLGTCFCDSKRAWVASAAYEGTNVTIFRTSDGGRSWARTDLSQTRHISDVSLSFPDSHTGWLMLNSVFTMNSSAADLYKIGDGGANWQKVNSTDASPHAWIWEEAALPEFEHRHPYLVCGGATAFRNDSTGWVWGRLANTAPTFLFITRDYGLTWQVQTLPLPSSLHDGRMEPIGLPHFFPTGGKDGITVAGFRPTDSESTNFCTVIYTTHDGGLTWQPTTPLKCMDVWDFITDRKGWIWSAESHGTGSTAPVKGTLYRTEDGGSSWRPVKAARSLEEYLTHGEDIVQLDFVDAEHGWAIARDGHNLTQLIGTTDGGKNWNAIERRIQLVAK